MSERKNVARLVRVLAVFVIVPTVTIGGVMLWDPGTRNEHWLHASGFAVLAAAAIAAFVAAPQIAARFVREESSD